MTKFLRSALVALLVPLGTASAAPYSTLYVFGDSLSDAGRAYALASSASPALAEAWMPSAIGYAQRFSDGPTAAEALAANLGLSASPWGTPGGTNFAVGGAMTATRSLTVPTPGGPFTLTGGNFNWMVDSPAGLRSVPALRDTSVADQVSTFLAAPLSAADALFMVQGGANDFFFASSTGQLTDADSVRALADSSASNLAASIQRLIAEGGAQTVFVPNLPDIGRTPLFGRNSISRPGGTADPLGATIASLYSGTYNAELAAELAQLRLLFPSVDLIGFDVFSAFAGVLDDAADYGFDPSRNGTSCVADRLRGVAQALAGCAGYLFWDDVHPTAAAHRLTGDLYAAAVPSPGTLLLLGAGLAALGVRRAARGRTPAHA